ncbi:MAG: hypothetical protein ABIJ21_03765 [Nanoarchaeota archaeon]
MGQKNVHIFLALFLLSLGLVSGSQLPSHPRGFDATINSSDQANAFDEDYSTFAHINLSDGNLTFFNFNISSHPDAEPLYVVNLVIDLEVSGITDDRWAIRYSDDNGTTQYDLRLFSAENVVRQNLTLSNLTEHGNGVWVWSEIMEKLKIIIAGLNDSVPDGAVMHVYEVRVVVGLDDEIPLVSAVSPQNNSVWELSSAVLFNYTVSDNSTIVSCDLYLNDSFNSSQSYPDKDRLNTFNVTLENKEYFWLVNCTDSNDIWSDAGRNYVAIDANREPEVLSVTSLPVVVPSLGDIVQVECNASVTDLDGLGDLVNVQASLYHSSSSNGAPDESSLHLSNASCDSIYEGGGYRNYTCGFSVWYYAVPGEWACNATAVDMNGTTGFNHSVVNVSTIFGMNITPLIIDYGVLNPGENSTADSAITIENVGNGEMDVALFGYGASEGDGLSMACDEGNISIGYERYSLSGGLLYSLMTSLTATAVQLDSFNLEPKNDTFSPTRDVYWKMGVPKPQKGNCSGFVVVSLVQS